MQGMEGNDMNTKHYAIRRDNKTGLYYIEDKRTGENVFGLMSLQEARALLSAR